MNELKYISQGNNGKVIINCNELQSNAFVDAVKVRNICKVRILSGSEKATIEPGSPDVKITSITGEHYMIFRGDLAKNFVHASGRPIVLAFLKNNKDYIVYNTCNEPYKVMQLPNNSIGRFNGKNVAAGSYVVAKTDESGSANMQSCYIISANIFRKAFRIPMQDVIKRHLGSGSKEFSLFKRFNEPNIDVQTHRPITMGTQNVSNTQSRPRFDASKLNLNPNNINIPTVNENIERDRQNNDTNSKYKITVINRVVDVAGNPKGYTIQEISTGRKKVVTDAHLAMLCEKHMVNNVMVTTRESTGIKYLRGNGIVLNNLPKVIG